MGQFADIRPFNDEEIPVVLQRLVADRELLAAIAKLKLGPGYRSFYWAIFPLISWYLRRQIKGVGSVRDFQKVVKHYMDEMVIRSTSGFTSSGLEQLEVGKPYLFMSNHRDIVLDPAFVNYALYHSNHDTVRIAIGDNLLTKPFVSDLMRINKSFIVKRSAKGPRQVLAAYKMLSAYIRHSIEEEGHSIWIAQREGRAKDGNDLTEPAIIKMLAMSMDKQTENFSDYINSLHIVPVSISYELDPCDGAKARELYETRTHGKYEKYEHEDVASIATGIAGQKGKVHVAFGQPLVGQFDTAEAVAAAVDAQVVANYHLHPTNFFAYELLHGKAASLPGYERENTAKLQRLKLSFERRINALPQQHRDIALGIYANIVERKLKAEGACDNAVQSENAH